MLIGFGVGSRLAGLPAQAATQLAALTATVGTSTQTLHKYTARLDALEQSLTTLTATLDQGVLLPSSVETPSAGSHFDEAALRHKVTQLLREELRELLVEVNTHQARGHATEAGENRVRTAEGETREAITNTPENKAAYEQSYDLVQGAFATGRWTTEDAQHLRHAFEHLTDTQREDVLQFLIVAINNGEIAVETDGPLF